MSVQFRKPNRLHKSEIMDRNFIFVKRIFKYFFNKLLCLSGLEMAPTRQNPLLKNILGARMKIMLEEQLVDPPITLTLPLL